MENRILGGYWTLHRHARFHPVFTLRGVNGADDISRMPMQHREALGAEKFFRPFEQNKSKPAGGGGGKASQGGMRINGSALSKLPPKRRRNAAASWAI